MKKSRNSNMDSAISIAAFVIQMMKGDYLDVSHWFEYFDVMETAVKNGRNRIRKH